ncbi:fatty acid desaturase family protein [Pontibacter akesuensis]|uniref:Linoleoyl-CoA desaturase n=1 Tax=Pontibacter akesuensis TaxID=388950 RepID=A0A1I7H280_9BACT|nr:acyl-CoA desaturase [Pontibacter akesuensis]GHA53861.1 fatty acid desaturase [Pontibacter akesuensis]SFU54809.1 linoleoyl-CoA desaturase [Pontibacter akesuensis]
MNVKTKVKFVSKDKNLFFATLRKRVDTYFIENNIAKTANTTMVVKSVVLLLGYIMPFILLLALQPALWVSMGLWFIMGLSVAGIGMSVMHDANHGAYSTNKKVNDMMGFTLNLVGGSAFNWKLQHNVLHHTYTNVVEMDEDIQDRLVLRFNPHSKVKFFHKLQWLYAFAFYGLLTLYWVVAKDFVQYALFKKNGVNANSDAKNRTLLLKIVSMKVIYLFTLLAVPPLFFGIPFVQVLLGFLLMHFVAGIILTVVFQLAHTVEGTSHPRPDEHGNIENDWAIHQLNTTVNFSRNNKWISWYVGGLNFQIEHHLFPRVCHVHYPAISSIVRETAAEYGIPYMENETFGQAVNSHIATLRRFGRLPDLNEAIG